MLSILPRLHAQGRGPDVVSLAFTSAGSGGFLLVAIALFLLNVIPVVWVARDAKARAVDGAEFWIALVVFFSVIGVAAYLICRSRGGRDASRGT